MKHTANVIQRHKHTVTFTIEDVKLALIRYAKEEYLIKGIFVDSAQLELPSEDDDEQNIIIEFDSI